MNERVVVLETPGAWAEPLRWPLRDGESKILTVGSNADWSIADGALLPVHATLYFDGASLCVAAAPGALLDGKPLVQDWSPVALPAQLSLGETKITLAPSEPAPLGTAPNEPAPLGTAPSELEALTQKTTIMGFPDLEEFRQVSRIAGAAKRWRETLDEQASTPSETAEPGEANRITPTGAFHSPFVDPDATAFYVRPSTSAAPTSIPPASPEPFAAASLAPAAPAPPVTPAAARSSIVRSFQSASWPKRLTVLLLPVVIGLYAVKAIRQPKRANTARPAPSASAVTSAHAAASADLAPQAAVPLLNAPAPTSEGRTAGLTLQRRAVDAFATGNFREAAQLYQRLSRENPRDSAYPIAARVASEKANGTVHD